MKNNKKKSPMMKIVSAAAMLAVSASMLGTSTYAWFSMNKSVSVTGMKLKATAEDGLVISDYTKTNWATSWTVTGDAVALAPTSTNGTAWATAASGEYDNAQKNAPASGYTDLSLTYSDSPTTGEGVGSSSTTNYVLLRKFYIKATGDNPWNTSLVVDEVSASTTTSNSGDLNKALRVLVVVGTDKFIYAPISGYDNACKFKGTGDNLTLYSSTTDNTCTSTATNGIPLVSSNTAPIEVAMYMYYEGEDTNCKSSKISGITVDDLTVSAKFKTLAGPADPPANP